MNEFEEVLKLFGQAIMAFFALSIGFIFLSALAPMVNNLAPVLGFGFIILFLSIIIITIIEFIQKIKQGF